jgi:hypothetical protein
MEKAKKEISGTVSGLNSGYQATEIFVYTWIAFEAFTCLKYKLSGVGDRKNAFCKDFGLRYNQEYDLLPDDCKRMAIGLASYTILDMTPTNIKKKPIKITDVKNLSQVLDAIYRVRCNLFHGGKDINEITDIALVSASGTLLYCILEKFLKEENYI